MRPARARASWRCKGVHARHAPCAAAGGAACFPACRRIPPGARVLAGGALVLGDCPEADWATPPVCCRCDACVVAATMDSQWTAQLARAGAGNAAVSFPRNPALPIPFFLLALAALPVPRPCARWRISFWELLCPAFAFCGNLRPPRLLCTGNEPDSVSVWHQRGLGRNRSRRWTAFEFSAGQSLLLHSL